MLCKNPFACGSERFGCGKCLPCRINQRRVWAHRIMLEQMYNDESCFVTLTYDDKNMPAGMSLRKKDLQDWLKRLRRGYEPGRIRYYAVGEYGENFTKRPHYHAALFGVGVDPSISGADHVGNIEKSWQKGMIHVGELTYESASYIAGYVTKKVVEDDKAKSDGRAPGFAIMSLRPGIGYRAMEALSEVIRDGYGAEEVRSVGDVPNSLMHGVRRLPLGRYLVGKLRLMYGLPSDTQPPAAKLSAWKKMREMFRIAVIDQKDSKKSKQTIMDEKFKQKVMNVEKRFKIFKQKETL